MASEDVSFQCILRIAAPALLLNGIQSRPAKKRMLPAGGLRNEFRPFLHAQLRHHWLSLFRQPFWAIMAGAHLRQPLLLWGLQLMPPAFYSTSWLMAFLQRSALTLCRFTSPRLLQRFAQII